MQIIVETLKLPNGAHHNQTGDFTQIPYGYIEVPETLMTKYEASVPFMDLVIKNGKLIDIIKRDPPTPSEPPLPISTPTEKMRADLDYLAALQGVTL